MASLCKDKKSGWRILLVCADGKRRPIRFPACPKHEAWSFKTLVETLARLRTIGAYPDIDTLKKVDRLAPEMRKKLEALGLVDQVGSATLGEFVAGYIKKRTDVAPNTLTNFRQAEKVAVRYFGEDKLLSKVTEQDARDFLVWLKDPTGGGWSEATASRRCKRVKQFFEAARRSKLIPSNPFEGVKVGSQKNDSRRQYVPREVIEDVLEACPDNRWRLLVALARFAGLRVPSEIAQLRWSGIHWEKNRMEVYSPKTKNSRIIPIFPEVRGYLDKEFFSPGRDGEDFVFAGMNPGKNLRTRFERIIKRAGHAPWERLFQNLRASAATDIANRFPQHVAARWCGHTETIADAHYWQTVEEHFEEATEEKVAQNPAHSSVERGCTQERGVEETKAFSPSCPPMQWCTNVQAPPRGIEPLFSD